MDQNKGGVRTVRKSRKISRILSWVGVGIVIFLVVAYLGVSAYAASALTRPARNIDVAKYNPGVYGLDYQELSIPAREDALPIAAWYIPSDQNERVIILVHGYNNSRTNGFLDQFVPFAASLHEAGFSVMMIDLRGHGMSGDARFTFGPKERLDILGAVDWLKAQGYQQGKIGVLGYSLGAGSLIKAAAEESNISALWLDSAFADINPVFKDKWTEMTGLPKVFYPSTVAMVRLFYGYDISASRPIDDIASLAPRPIFMAHCQQDSLIPITHMERLLTVAQNVQTWVIPNCDINTAVVPVDLPKVFNNHAIGYYLNPDEYSHKVVQFFDENLK